MPKAPSYESEKRRERQSAQHYIESKVYTNDSLQDFISTLKKEYPFLEFTQPKDLHVTLGYYGSREELASRLRAMGISFTAKAISFQWSCLMHETESILDDPSTLYFNRLEVFDRSSLALVLDEGQEVNDAKVMVYQSFVRMLKNLGLTDEQAQHFIREGKRTRYLDPKVSRYHMTIARIPAGKSVGERPVARITCIADSSRLKKRFKS